MRIIQDGQILIDCVACSFGWQPLLAFDAPRGQPQTSLLLGSAIGSGLNPFVDDVEAANFHSRRFGQQTNRVRVAFQ
jgi:hypothetical protein